MRVKIRLRLEGRKLFHMNPAEEGYPEKPIGKDTLNESACPRT
jgi:hypothetical protein